MGSSKILPQNIGDRTNNNDVDTDDQLGSLIDQHIELLENLRQCSGRERKRACEKLAKQNAELRVSLLDKRTRNSEEKVKCVRVLESTFSPEVLDSRDTIGAYFLGEQNYNGFRKMMYVSGGGMASGLVLFIWVLGMLFAVLQIAHVIELDERLDLFCALAVFFKVMIFALEMNCRVCKLLMQRFDVWFNVLNSLGFSIALIILFDGKHKWVLGLGSVSEGIAIWFTDALPARKRNVAGKFAFPLGIVWYSSVQMFLLYGTENLVPFSYTIGALTWTASGQVASSSFTIILYFMRYLITSFGHPNTLLVLRARIASTKRIIETEK